MSDHGLDHCHIADAVWAAVVQSTATSLIAAGKRVEYPAYTGPIRDALWMGVASEEAASGNARESSPVGFDIRDHMATFRADALADELHSPLGNHVRDRMLLLADVGLLCWGIGISGPRYRPSHSESPGWHWVPSLAGLARFLENARDLIKWAYIPVTSEETRTHHAALLPIDRVVSLVDGFIRAKKKRK